MTWNLLSKLGEVENFIQELNSSYRLNREVIAEISVACVHLFNFFGIIQDLFTIYCRVIDTGTTRSPSAGHISKGNQKNFGEKLFTTNPLGALFTKSCEDTL